MCRALLYLGEPVLLDSFLYQPDSALVRQSYMPKARDGEQQLARFAVQPVKKALHASLRALSP